MKKLHPWMLSAWQQLDNCITGNRLHHALLISGMPGIGKTNFSHQLAMRLLCISPRLFTFEEGKNYSVDMPQNPPSETETRCSNNSNVTAREACGVCNACLWFSSSHHPDFRTIPPPDTPDETRADTTTTLVGKEESAAHPHTSSRTATTSIKIDQIRALTPFFEIGPYSISNKKIILIDPADAMTHPAANALLKILEEPPHSTQFILVSNDVFRLPATIRSRCFHLSIPPPSPDIALAWLVHQQTGVSLSMARDQLAASGGSPVRALSMLADPGAVAVCQLVLDTIIHLSHTGVTNAADRLAKVTPPIWLNIFSAWVSDAARVAVNAAPRFYPLHLKELTAFVEHTHLEQLTNLHQTLVSQTYSPSLNSRLLSELVLGKFYSFLK